MQVGNISGGLYSGGEIWWDGGTPDLPKLPNFRRTYVRLGTQIHPNWTFQVKRFLRLVLTQLRKGRDKISSWWFYVGDWCMCLFIYRF